jgi:hypothetical protein
MALLFDDLRFEGFKLIEFMILAPYLSTYIYRSILNGFPADACYFQAIHVAGHLRQKLHAASFRN